MTRDYAKRPKKRASRKSPAKKKAAVRPITWLFTGLLSGLVVASVVYLKMTLLPAGGEQAVSKQAASTPKPKTQAKNAQPVKTAEKKRTTPQFDFYTLLPEMEVAAPQKPAPTPKLAGSSNLSNTIDHAKYRLQLASFKRFNDADSLKAKLALSGHQVEIHSIKLEGGAIWYRVYTPILPSREQAVTLQKELQNQAINSMLLKAQEG